MDKKQQLEAFTEVKDGHMVAIASTETQDRMGDVLKLEDWDLKNFKRNPVLQAGHDYAPQFTIGVARNIRIEDKKLVFNPEFHDITPLAAQIKKMYEEGILKAWSVGFKPAMEEDEKHELLEISAVAVPANPDSLTFIEKSMESVSEKDGAVITDWVTKQVDIKEEENKTEEKAVVSLETGETNEHTHVASFDEDTGDGNTSVTNEHSHEVENFVVLESNDHTHSLDVEQVENQESDDDKSGHGKKPKKRKHKKDFEIPVRWNKQLSKAFDIESVPSNAQGNQLTLMTKFLGCKVKNVFTNDFAIPSPLLGTYLAGFKIILGEMNLKDTRAYDWSGSEVPPGYEIIKLNSTESDDFLISGVQYLTKDDQGLVAEFYPTWTGMRVALNTKNSDKEWNKEILERVHKWVDKNNYLKGEMFSLSGEFLEKSDDSWDQLVMNADSKDIIQKAAKKLSTKGMNMNSRGMLFYGKPGNGKTKTARIMMNESEETTFIWVSSKDFQQVGAVQTLSLAFDIAKRSAPSILLIEDIDTWIEGHSVDLMKTEMDGLKQDKGVITLLTSNEPDKLPDALLDRPGRFHDVIEFESPNADIRKEMLKRWSDADLTLDTIEKIIEETEGYSGAHMKELVEFAQTIVEDDDIEMEPALLKSLEKLKKQKELIAIIRSKKKGFENDVVEKEGRVISRKNKRVIGDTIAAMNKATEALEKLLDVSEPQAGEGKPEPKQVAPEKVSTKGRSRKVKPLSSDDLVKRTLKIIAGQTSKALQELNKYEKRT